MPITLSLSAADLDQEELQDLTRRLCRDLRDEAGADAAIVTRDAPGAKGDLPVWGQIVMTLIGSGGVVVTAIKVLEAYARKNRKLEIKLKTARGELVVKSENRNDAELAALLQSFLTEGEANTASKLLPQQSDE